MSFWLHQRSFTRRLSTIAPIYCYAVAVLISMLVVTGMCWYSLIPMNKRLQAVERQMVGLESQVAAFEAVAGQYQAFAAEHERLVARKQEFSADIATLQDTLNDVLLVIRDHKISCRGILPLAGKQDGFHEKHIVSVKGKGSFAKVIALLKAFEQPQYPITMRSVELIKARGNQVLFDATMQIISVKET